jgi:hypothetical protein
LFDAVAREEIAEPVDSATRTCFCSANSSKLTDCRHRMTLKLIVLAGGLLALAAGAIAHFTRARSGEIAGEQLSGDWLAQARAKQEEQW